MPFSQSRSWRFPIPFLAFPNPAPAFSSDGSGSASFYRCAPAAALPHSRPGRFFLSPPPGFSPIPFRSLFSNPAPAAFRSAWETIQRRRPGGCPRMEPPSPSPLRRRRPPGQDVNALADIAFSPAQAAAPWAGCERARGHRLLPCAGGGPTRHTQTRPPSAGGRLLYVSCGPRQKALPPRDGVRRAPPLGPSSSSPLRSGGPAGRSRPASGPNWNRFRVKIFVFAPRALTESLQNGIV